MTYADFCPDFPSGDQVCLFYHVWFSMQTFQKCIMPVFNKSVQILRNKETSLFKKINCLTLLLIGQSSLQVFLLPKTTYTEYVLHHTSEQQSIFTHRTNKTITVQISRNSLEQCLSISDAEVWPSLSLSALHNHLVKRPLHQYKDRIVLSLKGHENSVIIYQHSSCSKSVSIFVLIFGRTVFGYHSREKRRYFEKCRA